MEQFNLYEVFFEKNTKLQQQWDDKCNIRCSNTTDTIDIFRKILLLEHVRIQDCILDGFISLI